MADWNQGKMPVKNDGIYELVNNEEPASSGIVSSERSASKSESTMTKRVSAVDGDDDKTAMDVALSDGNGNGVDLDNPLPVYISDSPSTEIEDYDVQSVIKNGGTANHDYLTTSEFRSLYATCSSAGYGKFELQVETAPAAGTYNTLAVKFNSVSMPNVDFDIRNPAPIISGVNIRIVKTNLDNQDTDMYSTINGLEV